MNAATSSHPLRLDGALDPPLSRWPWLVKWLPVLEAVAASTKAPVAPAPAPAPGA